MRQEIGEGKTPVSSKRVDLTRGCGNVTDCRAELHDHNHYGHARGGPDRSCRVEENLNKGKSRFGLEDRVNVANAECKCDYHDEASGTIEDQRPDHSHGENAGCISDFLRCVTTLVRLLHELGLAEYIPI